MVRRPLILAFGIALSAAACGTNSTAGDAAVARPAVAEIPPSTTSTSTASTTTTVAAPGTPEHEVELAAIAAWDAQMVAFREVDGTRLWEHFGGDALSIIEEQVDDLRARGVTRYFTSSLHCTVQHVTATEAGVLLEYTLKGVERDIKTMDIRGRNTGQSGKVVLRMEKIKGAWRVEAFDEQ